MAADQDLTSDAEREDDAPAGPRRRMPTDVRDTLSWLAHLLDRSLPLRAAEDDHEFAQRHLGGDIAGLNAVRENLGPFTAPLVARVFAADLRRYPPYEVAGIVSDESPIWDRLRLEGAVETVPISLVAAFRAGTLSQVPLVVAISARWSAKEFVVHARAEDGETAERCLQAILARARGPENYLRGRCLQVRGDGHDIEVRHVPTPTATRSDVIAPDYVWAEVELNVASLFRRRALLTEMGLGTNRGLLLCGPPGTGKSALCRVLAAELAGEVTVVFCTAGVIADHIEDVYEELTRLAPALVILEDLDLVIGSRRDGDSGRLHRFLGALDGVMSRHQDVVTVATTNNVKALDNAAVRAARFDRVVEMPLPAAGQRAEILGRYLGPLVDRVDVGALAAATEGASGADLRELVRRGVLMHSEAVDTQALWTLVRSGAWAPRATGLYL